VNPGREINFISMGKNGAKKKSVPWNALFSISNILLVILQVQIRV
jgi:hypothetical protein